MYFPKLPAGQNNKKFIFKSILLNFATGELFVPTGVWKACCLRYIPSSASLVPPILPVGDGAAGLPSPLPASTPETRLDTGHSAPRSSGKGEKKQTARNHLPLPFSSSHLEMCEKTEKQEHENPSCQ